MASTELPERRRFTRTSDWHNFINEIAQSGTGADLYALRRACYADIEKVRGRPVIVYAVKFPGAHPAAPISIDLTDVDGFTDLIGGIADSEKKIDVILHSPGGSPEATERIVGLLRARFDDVTFLIPHSAYSAATTLALSGNEVILHPSATLGPIDPQINGTPARSIRRGFDKVRELLKRKDRKRSLRTFLSLRSTRSSCSRSATTHSSCRRSSRASGCGSSCLPATRRR